MSRDGGIAGGPSVCLPVEAHFGDCDPIGIVYYPNYFRWFDQGFTRLMASLDLAPAALLASHGARFPLVDIKARFLGPIEPGDRPTLTTSVARLSAKTVTFAHLLTLDGSPRVEGEETRVWALVGPQGGRDLKAAPIPEAARARLSGHST